MAAGKAPFFDVKFVAVSKDVKLNNRLFSVSIDKVISEVMTTDLIIIPALSGDLEHAVKINRNYLPWIVAQHNNGAEVASLCLGAFLLAATGLLDGKKCSTHWCASNQFRDMFPAVELTDGTIITEENRIYSSGGANSYWNLLLYLVEKYTDRDTAILASKYFAIDIDRESQSGFVMFKGQKEHRDEQVVTIQDFIESNYQERLSVNRLAGMVAIGRRSFERRFKKATSNTVGEYIQRVKMEAAKRRFESSQKNINEVMYDVGYTDTKAFRTVFKKITGFTPIEYRNKYNKIATASVAVAG